MSKIIKAMEKAQHDRTTPQREEQPEPAVKKMERRFVKPVDEGPKYQTTKVLPMDDVHLESQRVLSRFQTTSDAVDHYNMLRTNLMRKAGENDLKTIMITSARKREGKTLTSINLAISVSRQIQQNALLVDTDLRDPDISDYLGLGNEKGLTDHILDDADIPELLINPGLDRLVILPAGIAGRSSTEILGSPKMKGLVEELKERYPDRYVFFDCPSLLASPDALVFSTFVDGIILVVEADSTPREDVQNALRLLEGRNVLGVVMNKTSNAETFIK